MSEAHPLLLSVQGYLERANAGASSMSAEVLDEAAAAFRAGLDRQFNRPESDRSWRLRMSNLGSPFCRLWHEKNGTPREPNPYNHPFKMVLGDAVEAAAVAVMRAAGVPIEATGQRATISVELSEDESLMIHGTDDMEAYGGIWDIKSASAYAFSEKFSPGRGWENLKHQDDFGYITQGAGYSKGRKKPFRGWVAINKESGEWSVLDIPPADRKPVLSGALEAASETVRKLESGAPFERCYDDVPEKFRGKETGNRILGPVCKWCPFKWSCWPSLTYERQKASQAFSPPFQYYTHVEAPANDD